MNFSRHLSQDLAKSEHGECSEDFLKAVRWFSIVHFLTNIIYVLVDEFRLGIFIHDHLAELTRLKLFAWMCVDTFSPVTFELFADALSENRKLLVSCELSLGEQ